MQNVSLSVSPSHIYGAASMPNTVAGTNARRFSWEGGHPEIEGRNRANLLDAFSQAHQFVTEAMDSLPDGKDIPETDKQRYQRWSHEIERAKKDPDAKFPVDEFAAETSHLCGLVGKTQKRNEPNKQWYGGVTGGKIFGSMNSQYFAPMVKSAIDGFSKETAHLPYEERVAAAKSFFNHLLDISGFARNLIAVMNSSDRPEQMGVRRKPGDTTRMEDECEKANYDKWRPAIKARMSSLVASHPHVKAAFAEGKSLRDLVAQQPATHGVHHLSLTADGHTVELDLDRSFDPPKCIGAFYACPLNMSAAHYVFEWAQDAEGLVATNMWCHHPQLDVNNIVETAAVEFEAVCNWDGTNIDQFRDNVASLLYKIANSSTFFAGQQAITEKFLSGLMASKGLKMTIEGAFKDPTYDQHALSMIHQGGPEEFKAMARECIKLERA